MRILITGTAGFIGYHLINRLVGEDDVELLGIDNINSYYDPELKYNRLRQCGVEKNEIRPGSKVTSALLANYQFSQIELQDKKALHSIVEDFKPDILVHLAAQAGVRYSIENPQAYIDSNIQGFINILEACRHHNIKHLIYASTSSVYGLNERQPFSVHSNVDHPISLYAATKKANELMAHTYSYLYKLPTTGLRFFTVYGPWGRPDMALFKFTKAIINSEPIDVYNHGNMQRDFTYVDDIVEGIHRIVNGNPAAANSNWDANSPDPASSPAPYRIYNIGNSAPVQLMDFIRAIEKAIGRKANINFMPLQAGDVKSTFADVGDLKRDFNYTPGKQIEAGVAEFVHWYRSYYGV
jgi:UDP-glucuronate 4-epimerase